MSVHGELAGGAAQRRRERRLRSWLRHERQTVAMVLAEACHHSSGSFPPTLKERRMAGQDAYEALRGQRTARTAGLHPNELVEPGVQGRLVAHSRPGCGGAPSPSLPHLAGGDTLDDTSVHFLLEMALLSPEEVEQLREAERRKLAREEKEKEEKKRREKEWQELFARGTAEYLNSLSQSSSSTSQRRRKKRKKKKLPKSGCRLFPPGCGRPCDHASDPVHPQTIGLPVVMAQRQVSTVHALQLQVPFLDTVSDMPGVVLREVPGLMVQKTVVRPQLQSIYGRRHSLSFSRGSSPWSSLSRPQRFSSCCSISGGRCPCCVGRVLVTIRLGCVPLGCRRPSSSWPLWTRRTVAVACTRLVLLVTIHFALFSLPWFAGP